MPTGKTRTRNEVKEIIEGLGYTFIDEHFLNKKHRKVIIQSSEGYKYDVQLNDIIDGHKPSFVSTYNPFTLFNISIWLEIENKQFILCKNNSYKGAREKLFFQCLKNSCGEIFDMRWNAVYNSGCECPFCGGDRVGKYNNLAYLRPDLSAEWNYHKNILSPSDYTESSTKKVWWICGECNHDWMAKISSRSRGTGCPKCNQNKGEKRINNWLEKNWKNLVDVGFINKPIQQKKFLNCKNKRLLSFDFGLENSYNNWILIEFHGGQHYFSVEFFGGKRGFKKRKKNDEIKEKYCKDNNIPLLIIPYWEFNNIEKILENFCFNGV